MKVKNALALPTAVAFGKGDRDESFLAFIVKGTFRMDAGDRPAPLAKEQLPLRGADEPEDPEKPGGLLRYESDRVPFKPRSDVVLVGAARSPKGKPVTVLDVGIRVGALQKILRVFGDRAWSFPSANELEPVMSAPAPFVEMPLTYARAFGGTDEAAAGDAERRADSPAWSAANWFGRGFVAQRTVASLDKRPLANLEDPADPVVAWNSRPRPVGCGFFPRNSRPRVEHFGTYDDAWRERRAPELPADFRFDAFSGAHPDLQVDGYLAGNEFVTLTYVDAARPVLSFRLPCLRPILTIDAARPPGAGPETVPPRRVETRLDTLVFVPDDGVFYQVWRGRISPQDPDAPTITQIRVDYEVLPEAPPVDDRAPGAHRTP